ncbi:MAG: pilus assembly protein [Polaromonas sp.]
MNKQLYFSMRGQTPHGSLPQAGRLDATGAAIPGVFAKWRRMLRPGLLGLLVLLGGAPFRDAVAQTTVNMAQVPLLALKSAPGLVMLTMSRDERLFYAAYNDASDIDGDGVWDVGFKPNITYYGYFVSDRCYSYTTSGTDRFKPVSIASSTNGCASSTGRWNGNWLNWATTSRMDALRRVLYGGYRVTDPSSSSNPTILQGAYIPQDAHVWGKEYRPVTGRDSYDITFYTPFATPAAGKQHLFAVRSPAYTTTPSFAAGTTTAYPFPLPAPNLMVILNADQVTERIWNWASTDVGYAPIAADPAKFSISGGRSSVSIGSANTFAIDVEACVAIGGVREANCTGYPASSPTVWKPTGTLHDYSSNDALKFGLITGSYQNNYSGGVVRRNVASFNDEVDQATGVWKKVTEGSASVDGIARSIDRIAIYGWKGANYSCGSSFSSLRTQGGANDCQSWGAPVGEMMYEGLRYFAGKSAPTSAYFNGVDSPSTPDARLGLPLMGTSTSPWQNPYRAKASGGSLICSRAVQMVIADPTTSYDSDQLPGIPGAFAPPASLGAALGSNDLTGLNVSTESDAIWSGEALGTRNIFIGESGSLKDGNPTAKPASSFAQIRGLAPDATQTLGSYYSAAVARFGRATGIPIGAPMGSPAVPTVTGQQVDTLSVALGSVVPKIEVAYLGKKIAIVPVAKSVGPGGYVPSPAYGAYQATGTITGFYLDSFNNTSGPAGADYNASINGGRPTLSFLVNLSDSPDGNDYETDAIVRYDISVDTTGNLVLALSPVSTSAAGIEMHLGYAITGTTDDGLYLDMTSKPNGGPPTIKYYLDTLAGQGPAPSNGSRINSTVLPATATSRTFSFAASPPAAGYLPHDTLWYAAKYGGAGVLDSNGDPTNYFKISNPANLPAQMGKAFRAAAALAAVSSTSVVGVGQRSLGSAAIYQANYDSLTWSSRLYAFPVATSGTLLNTPIWEASSLIPAPVSRTKLFLGRGTTTTPQQLSAGGFALLNAAEQADFGNTDIYAYLLGDKSKEERKGGSLRNRGTTAGADFGSVLGDIVNSDPQIISKKDYGYTASDASYSTFLAGINFEALAVGSNDGFFHVFDAQPDATGGGELLGFMPQAARTNIKDLSAPGYKHRNIVDGSIGLGHAKIAVPGDPTQSWRSVAVAAGGDGVQTVFAINTSSKTYTADSILWEINQSSPDPKLGTTFGNVMGRPGIGKLSNGTWVAIFGNGYNSAAGTANLYVVRLSDGVILKVIDTNAAITGNGLGATEIVRKTSGNQDTIEYVYGADYKGNIWRFDLSNSSMASWPSTGALIYKTPAGRPITAEIKVGPAPSGGLTTGGKMIYFGTGSYLSAADPADTTVQALYGIYDDLLWGLNTSAFAVTADLSSMTISATAGSDVRTTSSATLPSWFTVPGKKGWIVQLTGSNVAAGERVIAPPVRYTVAGLVDAFLFTSIVPSTNECEAGLDAWITGIDAMTGGYRKVFNSINDNSVRISGGSPRGVFVLQDGGAPTLYISQTIFNGTISTTSFTTGTGGTQTVTINGIAGTTRVISVGLVNPVAPATSNRQVWRQLK